MNLICIPSSLVDTFYEIKNNRNETIAVQIDRKAYGKTQGTLEVGGSHQYNIRGFSNQGSPTAEFWENGKQILKIRLGQ